MSAPRCPYCHLQIVKEEGELCEAQGCAEGAALSFFHALCLVRHYRAHWLAELERDAEDAREALSQAREGRRSE